VVLTVVVRLSIEGHSDSYGLSSYPLRGRAFLLEAEIPTVSQMAGGIKESQHLPLVKRRIP
jgi:hypothetical protein